MVTRGTHPNSLANLRPPWNAETAATANRTGERGPIITPAIRRFSSLTLPQLYALDGDKLTVAELIAVRYLVQAMAIDGDRARADATDRLDGKVNDRDVLAVQVNVGVQLVWPDGTDA